ncbi:hypothetical protein LTS10_006887 [Elasticomyces elasticus]|nr:hypothetical protein LTS10_006887 [Elasticomyces elasticus]
MTSYIEFWPFADLTLLIFDPDIAQQITLLLKPSHELIVDDSLVFCDVMSECAGNGASFRLEEAATRVMVKIIGKVVLELKLNTAR